MMNRPIFGLSRCVAVMALALAWVITLGVFAPEACGATDGKIRVLMVTGDWKTQPWYQDVWMPAPGQKGKLYRGRFIEQKVTEVAPGKFEFMDITNYAGQEYVDSEFLSQFDVLLLGDVVGWSFNPQFRQAVNDFVNNGGGVIYCASWKWHCAVEKNTPFAEVLPAEFPADNWTGDWKAIGGGEEKEFAAVAAMPEHPVMKGLDWASAPKLLRSFQIIPKPKADVLLKSPTGTPVLAAWQFGKGRSMLSASIYANDELSEKFGDGWKDFGKYYAQAFAWLGENSTNKKIALKDGTGEVSVVVDFAKKLNPVSAKLFSLHGAHDSPGFSPLEGLALENFEAINPDGGFSRFAANCATARGKYDFKGVDDNLTQIKRLGLEPLALFGAYGYGKPDWMWTDGSSWSNPSSQAIQDAKDEIGAFLTHTNGKKGDANYKQTVTYIEICNEPDINFKTAPGFAKLFNGVAEYVHENFPGVKVGTFGSYEIPYLKAFIDNSGKYADWISRHPYGWTGEMIFKVQDDYTAYAKSKGYDHLKYIITECDFWIQGRQKFDYMVKRNLASVKRDDTLGLLHYRLGMYNEPIYLFGILWGGWGQDKGAGKPNTPMHDAYDAFWIFRDFRGDRAQTTTTAAETAGNLVKHVLADAAANGDRLNVVMYYDWAYGGQGYPNYKGGVLYNKVNAKVKLALTPSNKDRTLTLSRANGEGFEVVKKDVKIAAGQKEYTDTIEMAPVTAYSITIQ